MNAIGLSQCACCRRAISMIEILIVVLILAIAASLAVPMWSDADVTRLRAAADLLAADLAFAQVESISHGDDLRLVVFDTDNNQYHIAASSDPDTPITNPVGNQPYVTQFGQGRAAELTGVTISGYSLGGDDQVQFGIYGQLDQTTDATISLACAGRSITLTLDAVTGEVTIGPIN